MNERNLADEIKGPKLGQDAVVLMCASAAGAVAGQNWEAAELGAKIVLANHRHMFEAWAILGVSLARQKYFRMAAESFHHALEEKPNDVETWTALGECFISMLDYKAAAASLKRAMELDPKAAHPAGRRARAIVGRTIAKLSKE